MRRDLLISTSRTLNPRMLIPPRCKPDVAFLGSVEFRLTLGIAHHRD